MAESLLNSTKHEPPCRRTGFGRHGHDRKRVLGRPAKSQAATDNILRPSEPICPFANGQSYTVMREAAVIAPVIGLLFASGPPHVAGFVIPIRVRESVDCVKHRRPLANIRQKVLERLSPSFANDDATTAVAMKMRRPWIRTSLNHRHPRSVRWGRSFSAAGVPVFCRRLNPKAAARRVFSGREVVSQRESRFTAYAFAFPSRFLASVSGSFDDSETTKGRSGKIESFHVLLTVLHVVSHYTGGKL